MLCDYGLFGALDGRKHGLEKDCLRRVQCRRADAVRGERASGHPHASGLPPAERALSVGDVLLGEVEAHVSGDTSYTLSGSSPGRRTGAAG